MYLLIDNSHHHNNTNNDNDNANDDNNDNNNNNNNNENNNNDDDDDNNSTNDNRQHGPEGAAVGIIGASMGGAVALLVGHEQEPAVVGIATDCAFSGIADVLEARIGGALRLPAALSTAVTWVAGNLNPLLHGYSFRDVAPVAAVAEGGSARAGQVPLLLIHAENDDVVPVSHAHAIFKAAAVPPQDKRLVVVQHCHHIGCFFRDRPGYKKLLTRFFDDAFARAEAESGARGGRKLGRAQE